jgi:hypothetical protein
MDYPYQYHLEEVAAQDAMIMSAEDKKAFFPRERRAGIRTITRCCRRYLYQWHTLDVS